MLYLVTARVRKSQYMDDEETYEDIIRLVDADSEEAAERKLDKHYQALSDEYGTYYYVNPIEASAIIS